MSDSVPPVSRKETDVHELLLELGITAAGQTRNMLEKAGIKAGETNPGLTIPESITNEIDLPSALEALPGEIQRLMSEIDSVDPSPSEASLKEIRAQLGESGVCLTLKKRDWGEGMERIWVDIGVGNQGFYSILIVSINCDKRTKQLQREGVGSWVENALNWGDAEEKINQSRHLLMDAALTTLFPQGGTVKTTLVKPDKNIKVGRLVEFLRLGWRGAQGLDQEIIESLLSGEGPYALRQHPGSKTPNPELGVIQADHDIIIARTGQGTETADDYCQFLNQEWQGRRHGPWIITKEGEQGWRKGANAQYYGVDYGNKPGETRVHRPGAVGLELVYEVLSDPSVVQGIVDRVRKDPRAGLE